MLMARWGAVEGVVVTVGCVGRAVGLRCEERRLRQWRGERLRRRVQMGLRAVSSVPVERGHHLAAVGVGRRRGPGGRGPRWRGRPRRRRVESRGSGVLDNAAGARHLVLMMIHRAVAFVRVAVDHWPRCWDRNHADCLFPSSSDTAAQVSPSFPRRV